MEVDEALARLGRFGRFQIIFYVILSVVTSYPGAWSMLSIVFIGGFPEYLCKLPPGHTNSSYPVAHVDAKGNPQFDKCHMYQNISQGLNETIACPIGYEYFGDVGETIVSQWDLVCGHEYIPSMSQTVLVFGTMTGALICSMLADRFGRKPVFLISQLIMVVVGVVTVVADNLYVFFGLRFISGFVQQGIVLPGFILMCELFPAKDRTIAGTATQIMWGVAVCVLALFAYLIRNWQYLQLLITLPGLLVIPLFYYLPESVSWLVAHNRHKDADEVIRRAARFNGVQMPKNIFQIPDHGYQMPDCEKLPVNKFAGKLNSNMMRRKSVVTDETFVMSAKYTILDVFRHKRMLAYALIMTLLWFVNSMVYYGLSLSTSELAGDRYLNFFIGGAVEIAAYIIAIFVLQIWGRRRPLIAFHIIAGCALVICLFIPEEAFGFSLRWLIVTLNMIGKFGITGSFATVFLYAPEVFPTTLRIQAMGIASVGGRIGNMLAPFSQLLAMEVFWLPGIIFGVLSIAVGFLAILLPETRDRPLPRTIEDIENWSKTQAPTNRWR